MSVAEPAAAVRPRTGGHNEKQPLTRFTIGAAATWTALAGASLLWSLVGAGALPPAGGAGGQVVAGPGAALLWGHTLVWSAGLAGLAYVFRRALRRAGERQASALAEARREQDLLRAGTIEAVNRVSGGIAHDFNGLLAPILGHVHLALAEAPDTPEMANLREDLHRIQHAAEQAREMALRLLSSGREDEEHVEPTDIGRLVTGVMGLLRHLAGPVVELHVALDPAAPIALADRDVLEVALARLAAAARDAMPQGGVVKLSTSIRRVDGDEGGRGGVGPGEYAVLELTSEPAPNGERALHSPTVTAPADAGTARAPGGDPRRFVALAGSVRRAGGAVVLHEAPGRGVACRMLLPAAPAGAREPPLRASPGSESVLLVEADLAVLHFASAVLGHLGYQVQAVASAGQAMALSSGGGRFDLLVADVATPSMRGTELWRRFAQLQPHARVLFTSSHAPVPLEARAQPAALLAKPFTPGELAAAVRRALARPAAWQLPAF